MQIDMNWVKLTEEMITGLATPLTQNVLRMGLTWCIYNVGWLASTTRHENKDFLLRIHAQLIHNEGGRIELLGSTV